VETRQDIQNVGPIEKLLRSSGKSFFPSESVKNPLSL